MRRDPGLTPWAIFFPPFGRVVAIPMIVRSPVPEAGPGVLVHLSSRETEMSAKPPRLLCGRKGHGVESFHPRVDHGHTACCVGVQIENCRAVLTDKAAGTNG